ALVNVFMYIDSSATISKKIERDSLHLLVGMPESWDVVEAQFVVVRDLGNQQMLALESGGLDEQTVAALLQQYKSQAIDLPTDASLPSAINGKTIKAHDQSNEEDVPVDVDDVEVWQGFGAPADIVLEKGDEPDTVISLDSAVAIFEGFDAISDSDLVEIEELKNNSLFDLNDSIGICIVPVAIFLKIQTGDQEGNDTLYYFTKTGKMNQAPSTIITILAPEMADIETGDMVYAPVTVTSGARVKGDRARFAHPAAKVIADRTTGTVRIDLGAGNRHPVSIDIHAIQGTLVRSLTPAVAAGSILWDGADAQGNRVRSGSYLVRITDSKGSVAHNVQLIR
ncbi:MAG: hypothetical protein JXA18_06435, partial [Chitinispirillaceae bacterium]|nr:hypothetical protein [Chitinispirillaceae bacterium]